MNLARYCPYVRHCLFDLWLSTDGAEVLWEISTMYKIIENK